jgi:GT2 family glycosyltransferase/glycosyltransferase involved in cell wall biosynthesis
MKVLLVAHGFPPAAQGGSEICAQTHARALQRLYGDEVLVLTREQDRAREEYAVRTEDRGGLRIVCINNTFRHTRCFEDTYCNETIGRIADRVIDDFAPDAAHIHHLTCLSTTIVQSLADRGIPRFVTLHDYWLMCHRGQRLDVNYRVCAGPGAHGCGACVGAAGGAGAMAFAGAGVIRFVERRLPADAARHFGRAARRIGSLVSSRREAADHERRRCEHMRAICGEVTHFFAPSRCMRDAFVAFGVSPERITIAPYGFDREALGHVARMPSDRLRIGFLGSLMISKAPHVLLEAFGRLPAGVATVNLFGAFADYHGDDSYRRQLDPLIAVDGVRVHAAVPHERIAEALASIDVLVVPSVWPENSPLVIQEAFLAGIPVVASRIGGIPEVVDEGRNGLLFRAGDVDDLTRALRPLLQTPALLDRLRSGIPAVRTIEEDVQLTRGMYRGAATAIASHSTRTVAIVLHYRTPDDTLLAVRSLLASRRPLVEIIVINNDSTDDAGRFLEETLPKITYRHAGRNLGFSGGVNLGIRQALRRGADAVLLVNSDVIVPPDCLERLERALDRMDAAGIAGPVILSRAAPDRIASFGMSYQSRTGRMLNRQNGVAFDLARPPATTIVDGVNGSVMLVKRAVFEAIGLFDEDYFFGFEDLDFCLRATRAGFRTIVVGGAVAYHEGSRSIGASAPRRLYFAARNHLRLAERAAPSRTAIGRRAREAAIVLLNVAHAVRTGGGSMGTRIRAVVAGSRDYFAGRSGRD